MYIIDSNITKKSIEDLIMLLNNKNDITKEELENLLNYKIHDFKIEYIDDGYVSIQIVPVQEIKEIIVTTKLINND